MALVVKDRVKQFSTTTGTGTITLGATPTGFQSFSVIGDGSTTYYAIVDNENGDWEVGLGTYTLSGTTLARTTVLESSNAGSLVNFAAGTKEVFVTYPAEKAVYGQANDTIQASTLGTAALPSYSFSVDPNTGVYSPGADQIALTTGGVARLTTTTTEVTSTLPLRLPNGSAGALTAASSSNTNNGLYFSTTEVGLVTVGVLRFAANASRAYSTVPWNGPSGSASTPALAPFSQQNSGIFFPGSGAIGFSNGGVERFRILSTTSSTPGALLNYGVFYYNARTISADATLLATDNAMSVGPLEISSGVVVTVPNGGSWVVL